MNESEKTARARLKYIGVKDEDITVKAGYVYYRGYMLHPVLTAIQISMTELAKDVDNLRRAISVKEK